MNSLQLSPQQAAQHLLNRRRARTDVVAYAGIIDVPGRPLSDDPDCELFEPVETNLAEHHKLILRAMEQTAATRYGRLMIFAPPGSAKSSYASVVFPSHYLAAKPRRRLILASYGADLARKMGRRTRSIIQQPRHARVFDAVLSPDSRAAEQFSLTNGSEYMASGLQGGITGNRADGAVVDDPLSGRLEAESQKERDNAWDAFHDDLLFRLIPGGWLTVIMTRWHPDDIAGRILPEGWNGDSGEFDCRDGRRWRVLSLQAKCETSTDPLGRKIGEYLWSDWFDTEHWIDAERDLRAWNSMFQQRPVPMGGAFFTEEHLLVEGPLGADGKSTRIPVEPTKHQSCVFAIIDTAVKTGKDHDGLGVIYCAYSQNIGVPLTILDWDLTQIEGAMLEAWLPSVFLRLEDYAKDLEAVRGSLGAYIEDKAAGMVLLQQAHNKQWPAQAINSKLTSLGKVERALNVSGYVHSGKVKLSRKAYEKVVTYKGSTKNHLLSQVLAFSPEVKDQGADDLLDCFTYSVALALGNSRGF